MKTIRLLYPDFISGGSEVYYFGSNLLQHILPKNDKQRLIKVDVLPPEETETDVVDGIYGTEFVAHGIMSAIEKIEEEQPDRIITIGGNCLVSFAPFDYLHGKYDNVGIIWIDAHADVSVKDNGYPYPHAMVLGALLGSGEKLFAEHMKNPAFKGEDVLYVGLQDLHDYQEVFLNKANVNYTVQTNGPLPIEAIREFAKQYGHILVHFDIDALDEKLFHSTYFANPEAGGDGSGGGIMTMDQVGAVLRIIDETSSVEGFTIAEYLPFDEYRLHNMLKEVSIFKN
ncbi:arginase family protein [Veillonella agrestimuris]|uniref:arginase family protein n=1 Tax=Veillonella agrestimuris TaxID=2941340 RepID=UPI0020416F5E|nr:arginase family protein [Veillonella agrestimuris]